MARTRFIWTKRAIERWADGKPTPDAATALDVKTERDINLLTNQPVVRIFARRPPTRRWSRFVVYATKTEPAEYIEEHAAEIAEKWMAMQ